jgi:hypothetical protein
MNKPFSLIFGIILVLTGVLLLAANLFWPVAWFYTRLWPLFIVVAGAVLMAVPLLARAHGLGALFIPGTPILATGGILLFTSVTGLWGAWAVLWPFEVLGLAAGFILAALHMRSIWMTLPAVPLGLTGLVLMFCALTGWWESWAVLWTVEPLAIGIMLLIAAGQQRAKALFIAGAIFCTFAGAAFLGMSAILLADWRMFRLAGPVTLVAAGLALLFWGITARQRDLPPTSEA